jgi:hypothetical protein
LWEQEDEGKESRIPRKLHDMLYSPSLSIMLYALAPCASLTGHKPPNFDPLQNDSHVFIHSFTYASPNPYHIY